jgi:hypothetical protein
MDKDLYRETGTLFKQSPLSSPTGEGFAAKVRSVVADHARQLQGMLSQAKQAKGKFTQGMAGKKRTTLPGGVLVETWINPNGLTPTLMSKVTYPKAEKKKPEYITGTLAFIAASGNPGVLSNGGLLTSARRVYLFPYDHEAEDELAYVTIIGQQGDHRRANYDGSFAIDRVGWLGKRSDSEARWKVTNSHPGNFGVQNWVGHDEYDVLSWDGPTSRFFEAEGAAYVFYRRRIYHHMEICADFEPYVASEGWDIWNISGAGIRKEAEDTWLYVITKSSDRLTLRAFRWRIAKVESEIETNTFETVYRTAGDPILLHTYSLYADHVSDGAVSTARTGFYFNASCSEAVCTIGSETPRYQTFLYRYTVGSGFSRELMYDATIQDKDSGTIRYPARLIDEPLKAFDVGFMPMPSPLPRSYGYGQYVITGGPFVAAANDALSYEYKTLSVRQFVCADFKGDLLVYLYSENPEVTHNYDLTAGYLANFSFDNCESYWLGSYPCIGNIKGRVEQWPTTSRVDVSVSSRKYYSSDGALQWESDTCNTHLYMDGVEDGFVPGQYTHPSLQIPSLAQGRMLEDPFTLNVKPVSTGWSYNNLADCAANMKVHTITFLDLRYDFMIVREAQYDEVAMVDWRMDNFEAYPDTQNATMHELQKAYVIEGREVLAEPTIFEATTELPIGIASLLYGFGSESGYGFDYWYRLYNYYIPMPDDPEAVGSDMYQPWLYAAKQWTAFTPVVPRFPAGGWGNAGSGQIQGTGSMLKLGNDTLISFPYAEGELSERPGNWPSWETGAPLNQFSLLIVRDEFGEVLYTDDNPQKTFFNGDKSIHFLANLGVV